MSGEINIVYDEVYRKTAELRRHLETELRELSVTYRQAAVALNRMDGRANAEFVDAMAANQIKAQETAATLTQLLAFIDASAREVERSEQSISRVFESAKLRVTRTGADN